ncbi:hypothetical protein D9613_008754 [Agrocybe pediades]|uniref:Uncharacterized protein n=1 Tax=Agrocybe pediades TaxID=84607 RepID=A0A8H4QSE9_9AGAR|nr:hypothetical protein D9613_008754 [Agrocybe pediades]
MPAQMPSNAPRMTVTTPNDTNHDIGGLQNAAGRNRQQPGQANRRSVSSRSESSVPNSSSTHALARSTQPSGRSGPSSGSPSRTASHFQGSRHTTVTGGQFLNTLGHHTNLTVNLHQCGSVPSGEEEPPVQGSHPDTSATRDVDRLNEPQNRNIQAVMQLPVQRSNETYARHLLLKARGFPLWIPEPHRNLPMPYQRQGISIGDVGIVTYAGSFSFLFNICLPADDPINPRELPEGFAPINPPIDPIDIRTIIELKPGSFLGSNSITKSLAEPDDNPLSFEAQSSEGAILVMPEGAVSYHLENIATFRNYVTANLESWYRYANGPRGREAKNGDIRVVVGCDKSTSWGMATSQEQGSRLKLLSYKSEPTDSQNSQLVGYAWEYSGVAEVRAGPDPQEVRELRADDPEPSIKYANQSLFIRTLNPILGSGLWEKLNRDLGLAGPSDVYYTEQGSDSFHPATYQNMDGQSTPSNSNSRHINHPGRRRRSSILDNLQENISRKEDVVSSSLTPEIKDQCFHPSISLNRFLSETYPQARIIITEDRDWYSVIRENETELPPEHELYRRLLDVSNVEYDDNGDILYLKPTREPTRKSRKSEEQMKEEKEAVALQQSRTSCYIPPEIVGSILEHIDDDRKTLKVCSLVNRNFHGQVQRILREVILPFPYDKTNARLHELERVTKYVKHLVVIAMCNHNVMPVDLPLLRERDNPATGHSTPAPVPKFEALDKLTIRGCCDTNTHIWETGPSNQCRDFVSSLLSQAHNIRKLSIHDIFLFDAFRHLPQGQAIDLLTLVGRSSVSSDRILGNVQVSPVTIKGLHLEASPNGTAPNSINLICDSLVRVPQAMQPLLFFASCSLLEVQDQIDSQRVRDLWQCAGNMKDLVIHVQVLALRRTQWPLSLDRLPGLRTLEFHSVDSNKRNLPERATAMLNTLETTGLTRLTFTYDPPSDYMAFDMTPWGALDAAIVVLFNRSCVNRDTIIHIRIGKNVVDFPGSQTANFLPLSKFRGMQVQFFYV